MSSVSTIGDFIDESYGIWAHCLDPACARAAMLDLDAIAAKHGRSLVVVGEHSPLRRRLRCRCGSHDTTICIHPPTR